MAIDSDLISATLHRNSGCSQGSQEHSAQCVESSCVAQIWHLDGNK